MSNLKLKHILFTKEKGLGIITLNRPEALNSMNVQLLRDLGAVLKEIKDDPEVDVVILTGAGKAFCAGLDVKELGSLSPTQADHPLNIGFEVFTFFSNLEQPIIGALNGYVVTGGMELALICDILIASEKAVFRDTHARVGLIPGFGNSQKLPRIVGVSNAMQMLLTAKFVTAHEALRMGLISEVVPEDKLLTRAKELGEEILKGDRYAVRSVKKLVYEGLKTDLGNALTIESTRCRYEALMKSPEDINKRAKQILNKE